MLRFYAKQIGKNVSGTYFNEDTKETILVSNRNISEILSHNICDKGILESLSSIPLIIKNSVFLDEEKNEKQNSHLYINKYQYFLSGLKIKDNYFTVKSVIAIDQNNNRYYDHKLFNIEKSLLIDSLNKERGSFGVHTSYTQTTAPQKSSSIFNDKRLYEICQCPQSKFLDKNFEPKKEIIDAVRKGKTLDDLLHTPQRREPSRSVLDQFLKDKGPDTPSRCVSPPQKEITNPKNNGFEL